MIKKGSEFFTSLFLCHLGYTSENICFLIYALALNKINYLQRGYHEY